MFFETRQVPTAVLQVAQGILGLSMLLTGIRIWRGPFITDRIVALDLLGSLLMCQCILQVFESGFVFYLDIAAAIAVICFLATVAFARYLERKDNRL